MKPNTIGPLRRALAIPLLVLIGLAPMLWLFADALRSGNGGYIGAVGLFVVPVLVLLPIGIWGTYQDARRRRNEEFRE